MLLGQQAPHNNSIRFFAISFDARFLHHWRARLHHQEEQRLCGLAFMISRCESFLLVLGVRQGLQPIVAMVCFDSSAVVYVEYACMQCACFLSLGYRSGWQCRTLFLLSFLLEREQELDTISVETAVECLGHSDRLTTDVQYPAIGKEFPPCQEFLYRLVAMPKPQRSELSCLFYSLFIVFCSFV